MSLEFPGIIDLSWYNQGSWGGGGGWTGSGTTPLLSGPSAALREAEAGYDERVEAAFEASNAHSHLDRMQAAGQQGSHDGEAAQQAPALPQLPQGEVVLTEVGLPPPPAIIEQGARPPYVDVAELDDLPPAQSGSETITARGGGIDYGALRRRQVELSLATDVSNATTATTAPDASSRRPQTAEERQAIEQVIAQGGAGGRTYTAPSGQTVDEARRAVMASVARVEGIAVQYVQEYAQAAQLSLEVADGGTWRALTLSDLSDEGHVPGGRLAALVTSEIVGEMREYEAARERGLGAEAAAGLVIAAGRLPVMTLGSSLVQGGVRAGVAAGAGGVATMLAAAAPVGIALSTLAVPVLIGQYMVEAGRVQVEVDELPPPMWMMPTGGMPTSPPPSQPMPPPPVLPPIADNTARVNTSPLTTPAAPPNIQTGTPPFSTGQVPPPLLPFITPMMDDGLRQLITDPLLAREVPLGFNSPEQFANAADRFRAAAGVGDAVIGVRGSSATGIRHEGGTFGATSDVDFFVVSNELFAQAAFAGARVRDGALSVGATIRFFPELHAVERQLSQELGRAVSIRIFSQEGFDAVKTGDEVIRR